MVKFYNHHLFVYLFVYVNIILPFINKYLHLPSMFPMKCVGGPSAYILDIISLNQSFLR